MGRLRARFYDAIARILTKPRGNYNHIIPTDLEALRRTLRPGDVILVEGDQRVSEVIKYLTQSSWSHAVLYAGSAFLESRPSEEQEALLAAHGQDARHMVVEALWEGVVASPFSKYAGFNLRVCRPVGLRPEDTERVLREVIGQLGLRYDLKNLIDLARWFLPVSLVPRRFRRRALQFGSGLPTQVICSSLIGRAFQNVGFPIQPVLSTTPSKPAPRRWHERLLGRNRRPYAGIYTRRIPTILTPRDFDLSPYFEIVKLTLLEEPRFDYRRIQWLDGEERVAAVGGRTGS